jgi:dolichol kinase
LVYGGFLDENRLEFKRQMVHLLNGTTIAVAVYFLKPLIGLLVLAPLIAALIMLYTVPRVWPDLSIAHHLMYHFERRKDIKEFPFKGAIMYGLGIIAPIVLLRVNLACAVILILSVGDAFSNLVGRKYGRHKVGHRSFEGSLGFFLTASVAAAVLVPTPLAMLLSFVGAAIELFLPWDDNLTIPGGLALLVLLLGL